MSMETLEFVIHPDGRVEEKVTGISGRNCAEVTAAIEAQLGRVVDVKKTSEFFAEAQVAVTDSSALQNHQVTDVSSQAQW